ncbi:hypothetical protein DFH08DRAFT_1043407 [Mycena albidolilacea]|uniref:Uncharacterized protein n=1 Tax=Mycena albidolilacea TaxID=1033008 RepID=A0AAD7AHG8_9AGAR|nr:hypothetical protein DFH08DRAFT_1043407 [Mycena albidolilacea]
MWLAASRQQENDRGIMDSGQVRGVDSRQQRIRRYKRRAQSSVPTKPDYKALHPTAQKCEMIMALYPQVRENGYGEPEQLRPRQRNLGGCDIQGKVAGSGERAGWINFKGTIGQTFEFHLPGVGLRSVPVCDGSTVRRDGFRPVRRAALPALETDGYRTGSPV